VRVDGQTVTWTLAEGLAVGEQVTLTVRVSVGEAAYPSVTNTVVVASPTEQTNDAELIDDATAPVKPAAPVVISPEDPVVVTPGGPIVVTPGGPVVITPGGAIVITPGGALATTGAELNIWMLAVALLLMLSGGLFVGYHRSREAVAAE
jgi:LPXTG-motif cell wall-anchored protein